MSLLCQKGTVVRMAKIVLWNPWLVGYEPKSKVPVRGMEVRKEEGALLGT